MIHLYCYSCGLYICVPSDFAGGKGTCPRCKVSLRIPKPCNPEHVPYDANFRYLAEMVNNKPRPADKSIVITGKFGPSHLYKCAKCNNTFESILGKSCPQNRCPSCGHAATAVKKNIQFPRPEQNKSASVGHSLDPAGINASAVTPQQVPASMPAARPEPKPVPAPQASSVSEPKPVAAPQPVPVPVPVPAPAAQPQNINQLDGDFVTLHPCEDQTITPDILNAKLVK